MEKTNPDSDPAAAYASAALMMDVSLALIQSVGLSAMLRRCTEALMQHLNGAAGCIWLVNAEQDALDLRAGSCLSTEIEDLYRRVPIGQLLVGRIAHERKLADEALAEKAKEDGDADSVSVQGVLGRLIPILQATLGERLLRDTVEDVILTNKQATSVAIVVNELVSNAGKHGRGNVELTLCGEGDKVRLEVCDEGSGFSNGFDPQQTATTGLELIQNIVRYDLRGETSCHNRAEGGACVGITFPRPRS